MEEPNGWNETRWLTNRRRLQSFYTSHLFTSFHKHSLVENSMSLLGKLLFTISNTAERSRVVRRTMYVKILITTTTIVRKLQTWYTKNNHCWKYLRLNLKRLFLNMGYLHAGYIVTSMTVVSGIPWQMHSFNDVQTLLGNPPVYGPRFTISGRSGMYRWSVLQFFACPLHNLLKISME